MKIRKGFVSNSSSSSFVIKKEHLTRAQIEKIWNYGEVAAELGMEVHGPSWEITETETEISGSTSMDNFDMHEFLQKISLIPVEWEYGHW